MASVIRGSDNFDTADTGGGKALCTAWVNFDGTTTPPTIRDSFNVSSVIRTATGMYEIYFATPMDNTNWTMAGNSQGNVLYGESGVSTINKIGVYSSYQDSPYASYWNQIMIVGGKN